MCVRNAELPSDLNSTPIARFIRPDRPADRRGTRDVLNAPGLCSAKASREKRFLRESSHSPYRLGLLINTRRDSSVCLC